ncbi:MAG: Smr/MutS family protein [Leptothrix ochracea]|uniref:Smr/MutS family protein n=1 Tax=Leptothrix ochracea TaxID=735331 RepID=UPI0034E1B415
MGKKKHGLSPSAAPLAGTLAGTLADLRQLLREQRKAREAQEREHAARLAAERAAARNTAAREREVFHQAIGAVQPLRRGPAHRVIHAPPPPAWSPLPPSAFRSLAEPRSMQEALSDGFDPAWRGDHTAATDTPIAYGQEGVGTDVLVKLRHGVWRPQGQVDLHGLSRDQARELLVAFLAEAHHRHWRCVRIIHGQGWSSPSGTAILKARVPSWLVQSPHVRAFVQAPAAEGGAGALLVLLRLE